MRPKEGRGSITSVGQMSSSSSVFYYMRPTQDWFDLIGIWAELGLQYWSWAQTSTISVDSKGVCFLLYTLVVSMLAMTRLALVIWLCNISYCCFSALESIRLITFFSFFFLYFVVFSHFTMHSGISADFVIK